MQQFHYEGLITLCVVIIFLLLVLLAAFVVAYVLKWERLLDGIRIQALKTQKTEETFI